MIVSPPFTNPRSRCGYLPDRDWRLEHRIAHEITIDEYAALILQGWRHFGRTLFRPRCRGCDACRAIRIDVDRFRPDRSQRRAFKGNESDLRLVIAEPVADAPQLNLYHRYHAHMAEAKQWPDRQDEDLFEYRDSFVDNPFEVQEWRYYLGETLVGVGYVDPLPIGPSAITFLHDPDHLDRSLGTFNVLALIDQARQLGQPHVYLGYYVAGCPSLAYKARFATNQTLDPDGLWRDFHIRNS